MQAILIGIIDSAVGWFNYAVYGQVSNKINQAFVSKVSKEIAFIQTFAIFASSILTHLIDGLLFDTLRKNLGTKQSLLYSSLSMFVASAMVVITPGYEMIGILTPILLPTRRLLLGLSIGTESGGGIIYAIEHVNTQRRGIVSITSFRKSFLCFLRWMAISICNSIYLRDFQYLYPLAI
ncbi:MFS transporter [Candidatus Synchoanobacter obligatus]|uniref:MFS transporter n=1 Tax=Candidatus Synchoanobacter obligatus TaxID=2919597 RepID=A0ABT1L644_9GAMM|nr:MFS transporter [Candidatus Synchoanobacter obligatus]MCP8352655.1 MFS transporter [Candidatus Synchoanobacter obligatus]